ncbi:hypothetical protein A6R68_21553 [Neotoma lepida]|uniref:Corticotropin-releasing factor-binding protein n=1 Tax=Neotoma lepida TaxID=56216 RepID=A0A1A6HP76_NEOLE|nr:hypothetical protein A6R68_21553 [Neotoma lepida]
MRKIPAAERTSCRDKASMSLNFKLQCHFILILLTALRGESRYLEVSHSSTILNTFPGIRFSELQGGCPAPGPLNFSGPIYFPCQVQEAADYDPSSLFSAKLKRDLAEDEPYRRALRDIIIINYHHHHHHLKVFDGWILNKEKFPSAQDHPLPTVKRYTDFCESGLTRRSITSSQNVAMVFFRVHEPGNGFTLTIKTTPNLFPCNIISQTSNGRFTLVVPHRHQNCSFSIIYPVAIRISDLTLGHGHGQLQKPAAGCGETGDYVELLGGNVLDPSKMLPLADLCFPFQGPAQMKVSCDNAVVRMVSSGKYINRVTFEYRQLEPFELETSDGNSIPEFCLSHL